MIVGTLPDRPDKAEDCVFGTGSAGFSGWSKRKKLLDQTHKLWNENVSLGPPRLAPHILD
jgi:hypothetical protein